MTQILTAPTMAVSAAPDEPRPPAGGARRESRTAQPTGRGHIGLRTRILGAVVLAQLPVIGLLLYGITSEHIVIDPPQAIPVLIAGVLAAFSVTAATAWAVVSLLVLRPTRVLTETTRRLAAGELSARTGRTGSGELAELARTIDDMADATERKTRQVESLNHQLADRTRELETSNEELEAFAYSVSHDLRAPLRGIDGFTRILVEEHGAGLDDEARRYLGLVQDNARQMADLVDGLLAFSRLGRRAMHQQRVQPAVLAGKALEALRPEFEGRPVEVRIDESMPPCTGDAVLLQQVFANLIGNAVKYTRGRDPAVIEIGWRAGPAGDPTYFVKDNGHGFDMRYAHKLFGVFQRLHRAEEYEGSGVGLALVQRIVQRHGGRIWAEAEVGRGATFSFTLGGNQGGEDDR